jgi:hypothetical protein
MYKRTAITITNIIIIKRLVILKLRKNISILIFYSIKLIIEERFFILNFISINIRALSLIKALSSILYSKKNKKKLNIKN